MVDHSQMKLGKAPARHDARTLALADYVRRLAPAPRECNRLAKVTDLRMHLNDQLGDCTCATAAHIVHTWTGEDGAQVIVPDEAVLAMYEAVGGYRPGHPETDNGAVELDVLRYWQKHPLAGHELLAYATLRPRQTEEVRQAIHYFGAAYIGVALPLTAQSQDVWVVSGLHGDGEPGSWGGHAVPVVAYDKHFVTCITWGQLKRMSWNFFYAYCDEAYCCLGPDLVGPDGRSPEGFDLPQLLADLALIRH